MKPLVLVGGGGHCKSVIEAAESAGYSILGVLDVAENVGKDILAYKIVGTDDDIPAYVDKAEFVITVGFIKDPTIRIKLYNKVKEAGGKLATVIASTAYVSKYAEIDEGTVVLHQAFVNAGAKVGKNVILNTFTNIEHDAEIGDHCHISTGTMVNGEAKVLNSVFVGSQSVVNNGISICENCVVASGTVVSKNLTTPGVYAGNPVKLIKKN